MRRLALATTLIAGLLTLPASASELIVPSGSFGSGARSAGFVDPVSIAVDDAGRVYVADAGAGHVEVFDSAPAGNRYLLTIGDGKLVKPAAVAVDNRQRVYVADAGRNLVEAYESASRRFAPRGSIGGPGQALGQFDLPSAITTDPNQRLFVTEQGNLRVSIFRPARKGGIVFQSAFGIALPEPFVRPVAIARDTDGRLYIASSDDDGAVRAFNRRGRFISTIGGAAVRRPRGVAVDRFSRVVVSDTGGDRLLLYEPLRDGGALRDTFSGEGFTAPGPVALAPGALLYVLVGNRVMRMRVDDADVDGVADLGDNCLGLSNGNQADTDDDRRGDACDADDDADGRADGDDGCPTEFAPQGDEDGCRNPTSRLVVPQHERRYPASPSRIAGRADGGVLGILKIEVALARRLDEKSPTAAGSQCEFLQPGTKTFVARACSAPLWRVARGGDAWRISLPRGLLGAGPYVVFSRARQRGGALEAGRVLRRNVRTFSVGG